MIELSYGSAALPDQVFVAEFEACRYPKEHFRHADHIRLAWIYLQQHEYPVAEDRMRRSIHQFARQVGAAHKYHETITIAWMRLVRTASQFSSRIETFEEFARAHDWLLNKEAIFEFYSAERIKSERARTTWVEPDLKPIPTL
jgi:alkylated DNA nucleotide flippase Atl1